MNKPIKPNITIPQSFAENGIKTDFDDTLLADGFDNLRPDVLAGDNLNKFIDDTYKGLNYGIAAADAINLINEGETLTVKEGQLVSDKIGGGTGLQLFDTITKDHILTYEETEGLALQGTYVYKEAIAGSRYGYPDFYNKCLEEKESATATEVTLGDSTITMYINSNGHQFYNIADKEIVDTFFTTMGMAWFYGIDTENERVFLPRNNWFAIKGSVNTVPVMGNGMTLGLQGANNNRVGMFFANGGGAIGLNGANNAYGQSIGYGTSNWNLAGSSSVGITTDGTKSGIIADTSNVIQTDDNKYLYICIGNTTSYEGMTEVVNQGMEILEQVNQGIESRVNLEATNLSSEGKENVINLGIPDYSAGITVQLPFIAPTAGLIYARCQKTDSAGSAHRDVSVNGVAVFNPAWYANGQSAKDGWIYVSKNDVISITSSASTVHENFRFFPLKGVN